MTGASYIQLEFRNAGNRYMVEQGQSVPFDTPIIQSFNRDNQPHMQWHLDSDNPQNNGLIFNQAGTYFVSWFVAQQTGLATDGANFSMQLTLNEGAPEAITYDVIGSGHVTFSALSGFAVVTIPQSNAILRLVNVSNSRASLSKHTQVKAGIAVFSLTPDPVDQLLGHGHAQTNTVQDYNTDEIIVFGQRVKFDTQNIVTLDNAGQFTLSDPGTYLITWEIPIEGTDQYDSVYVQLLVNGTTHSTSYAALPTGLIAGSAVLTNGATPMTLALQISYPQDLGTDQETVRVAEFANIVIAQLDNVPEPTATPADEA